MIKLNHLALHAASKKNAVKFYNELLEFEIAYEFRVEKELAKKIFNLEVDLNVVMFKKNDISIEVFISPEISDRKNPINHFCIDLKERAKLINRLKENGIKILEIDRGDHTTIFVKDYDSNIIEIKEQA
ncbi:MAG: VOC family protein [Ignavibacteriae bacterium]|nr:VOC family protein [Ignavibacteriota bacterium]NOG96496.1 VOC family protein [Ignavibacteriota bacterium]